MGAKGSKPLPQAQSKQNTRANTRANKRANKRTNNTTRRNNVRVNKPPMPTYPYGMPKMDCSQYPPPDPERKVPRRTVPSGCLEQWESDIFLQQAIEQSRQRAAQPKPPIPLTIPSITWPLLQQRAEETRFKMNQVRLFTSPSKEEYALANCRVIEEVTPAGKKTYPLRRFFNANKEDLIGFCNYVYDSDVMRRHLEDGMEPYLILHRVVTEEGEAIEVVGFMIFDIYDDSIYIGDFCIGPKRGGLGRLVLEEIKALARERELDYVKLEPATNTEPFYEKLGFKASTTNKNHHVWFVKNGNRQNV